MRITSEKRIERLNKIIATAETPFMVCSTCGKATNKIQKRYSDTLRDYPKKKKTWNRVIRYSKDYKSTYNRRPCSKKMVYFSYQVLDCIKKKHKLTIRKRPFSSSLVSELV